MSTKEQETNLKEVAASEKAAEANIEKRTKERVAESKKIAADVAKRFKLETTEEPNKKEKSS